MGPRPIVGPERLAGLALGLRLPEVTVPRILHETTFAFESSGDATHVVEAFAFDHQRAGTEDFFALQGLIGEEVVRGDGKECGLAVVGAEDGATPPALVEDTAGLIPGSRFEVIQDCGHLLPLEEPDRVAQTIIRIARRG